MNTIFSLFLRFGPNIYQSYKDKSLLKSSELPALVLAGVGAIAPSIPGFPPEGAATAAAVVRDSLLYFSFRVAGKGLSVAAPPK